MCGLPGPSPLDKKGSGKVDSRRGLITLTSLLILWILLERRVQEMPVTVIGHAGEKIYRFPLFSPKWNGIFTPKNHW